MGLAVPEANRENKFCERCFAAIGKGETYCPECGAPTGEASPAADSAVHGELAQANLLRLRGELDASEKSLLSILRRFPNDPHAHEMLGDVCADRGENERAIEWYELALDLAPNAPDVRRKLTEARDRVDARDSAETAEQIGLPPATPPAAWWPLAASAAILLLAIVVAAWPRPAPPTMRRETVVATAPEVQTVASTENTPPTTETPTTVAPPTPSVTTPATTVTVQDQQLLADLRRVAEGSRVQSVATDPRGAVDVTFEVSDSDDPKALALSIGRSALTAAPTAIQTTLRAVKAGNLVFTADLARTDMEGADPLTNVWSASPGTAAGTTDPGTTIDSSTTGTTAPANGSPPPVGHSGP